MDTPIDRIMLALDGKIDMIKKTNPYGSSDGGEQTPNDGDIVPLNPNETQRKAIEYDIKAAFAQFSRGKQDG